MKHLLTLTAALTLLGCGTTSVTQSVQANNSKFVALGSLGSQLVQCTALQETVLPDGRLQVSANILNRANKRLDLQVNCIFKDEQGFGTGDETPFRTLVLDETAQETVLFTSLNPKAKNYTVRVRLARVRGGVQQTSNDPARTMCGALRFKGGRPWDPAAEGAHQ